jgi:lipopolysaccharide/colanic/teichoic acid biosynthesis glycosyltransferase
MLKRLFDIAASLAAMAFAYPAMLAIAMAIRADSRGPVIFRQRRAGLLGRAFVMLKFRTMRCDADAFGRSPESGDDPRLTKVGRWLRERSLEELPQLFNVLAGEMSLVGPRPLYERQAAQWTARQRLRLEVRPGITGWAQVSGRADLPIEDKIELDVWYVEHHSLGLDLRIILQTVRNALKAEGEIYEKQYSREQQREQVETTDEV